jgi:myo-inositol-1(or 4)-monophosphatase
MSDTAFLIEARGLALELGLLAARRLQQARAPGLEVEEKAPGDWCSALDREVEALLRQGIAARYPQHRFWGEEGSGGTPSAADLRGQRVWVVDPIDGSMNFLRGYPQYAVSIALLEDAQPVVACIVDPVRGEAYTAARGLGATCNGQPLAVATTAQLAQAVAATVFPKPQAPFMDTYLQELSVVMRKVAGVRRAGSMALELAYLAAGRIDVFWERGMGAWDAAAGLLLIEEAGGQLWSLDGRPWYAASALAASTSALRESWQALWPTGGAADLRGRST